MEDGKYDGYMQPASARPRLTSLKLSRAFVGIRLDESRRYRRTPVVLSPVTGKLISDVTSVAPKTRLNKIIKLYVLRNY